jgi:hypothetical protein
MLAYHKQFVWKKPPVMLAYHKRFVWKKPPVMCVYLKRFLIDCLRCCFTSQAEHLKRFLKALV